MSIAPQAKASLAARTRRNYRIESCKTSLSIKLEDEMRSFPGECAISDIIPIHSNDVSIGEISRLDDGLRAARYYHGEETRRF